MHVPIPRAHKREGLPLFAIPAAGVAMLAAACGSVSATGPGYGASGASTARPIGGGGSGGNPYGTGAASVKVATSGLGSILTDAQGRTLYLFTKDSASASSCTGACTNVWPPLVSSTAAQAGTGASAALLGTTINGGQTQVTYDGHPLYYYVGDANPGDTNGEQLDQFGGLWYAVSPGGTQVTQ